jgi:excisionase family DNA binding protein
VAPHPPRETLTTAEVARLMGVSKITVTRWIDGGGLAAHRTPGGHRRIPKPALIDYCRRRPAPLREPLWDRHCALVVDDQPVVRSAMVKLINLLDPVVPVLTAEDAFQAGQLFASYQPRIVFLDLVMPGPDGFTFHDRLREMEGGADTAVVVITGAPGDSVELRARGMGIQRFLRKPLTSAAIALILQEFLPAV